MYQPILFIILGEANWRVIDHNEAVKVRWKCIALHTMGSNNFRRSMQFNSYRNIYEKFNKGFPQVKAGRSDRCVFGWIVALPMYLSIIKWQKVGCFWKFFKPAICFLLKALYGGGCLTTARLVFQSRAKQVSTIFLKKSQFFFILLMKNATAEHHFSQKRIYRIAVRSKLSILEFNPRYKLI